MRRRAFLGFCIAISLFFPRLSRGIGVLGDKDELIIVNGWILRKSDLEELPK